MFITSINEQQIQPIAHRVRAAFSSPFVDYIIFTTFDNRVYLHSIKNDALRNRNQYTLSEHNNFDDEELVDNNCAGEELVLHLNAPLKNYSNGKQKQRASFDDFMDDYCGVYYF